MKPGLRFALYLLLLVAALVLAACASAPAPTLPPSPTPTVTPTPAATHTPTPSPTPTPAVLTAARLAALPAAGEGAVRCAGMDEADAALRALCLAAARGAPPALPVVTLSVARLPGGALAGARPAGLSLRPGMALSLVGWLREGEGEDRVVAAVREDRGGEAVVFLAAVDAAELGEVLAANGYGVETAGEGYRLRGPGLGVEGVALPQIPPQDPLYAQLQEAMGAVFFDKALGPDGEETFLTNPIVPHPPVDLVPDETAVSFQKDEKTATVTAVDASGKPLAQAKYDWEKKVWVWEKVEEEVTLTSAMLTREQIEYFLVGGEHLLEKDLQEKLTGKAFDVVDKGGRKMTILLSSGVQNYLNKNNLPLEKSKWWMIFLRILEKDATLKPVIEKNNFTRYEVEENKLRQLSINPPPIFFTQDPSGKPIIILLEDDNVAVNKLYSGWVIDLNDRRKIPLYADKLNSTQLKEGGFWEIINRFDFRISYETGELLADDGYQVVAKLEFDDQGSPTWRRVLPHERKNGQYELLTPEQRMGKAMADLMEITGYDGSGLWEKRPNTVVDYTDTQGQRRHQEVEIYFVHSSQDPKSPIIYEVIKDPATGEMMFTIRKAKEGNKENIQGLNEQQAALVRQAWAYLLAADPAVMQKFWRVNKTMGVGLNKTLQGIVSTNLLYNGRCGLILARDDSFSIINSLGMILTESYELYAAQFGWVEASDGKDGIIYTNTPPDCLDLEPEIEAQKKVILWIKKYGLGNKIFLEVKDISQSIVNGYPELSRVCQPQIPFEP